MIHFLVLPQGKVLLYIPTLFLFTYYYKENSIRSLQLNFSQPHFLNPIFCLWKNSSGKYSESGLGISFLGPLLPSPYFIHILVQVNHWTEHYPISIGSKLASETTWIFVSLPHSNSWERTWGSHNVPGALPNR
jgi:hypothetical protein